MTRKIIDTLSVEDSKTCAAEIAMCLKEAVHYQYEVTTVSNYEDACASLKTKFYDLVLLDMSLPDMNGTTLIQKVRCLAPQSALVVWTASESEEDAVSALAQGIQGYFVKGMDHNELLRQLRRILTSHLSDWNRRFAPLNQSITNAYVELDANMKSFRAEVQPVKTE